MTEAQARGEIVRVGRSLFERGYVHATAGNISVRLPDGGCLITPTDACLGFLDPERLARVDVAGQQIAGDTASKTLALHRIGRSKDLRYEYTSCRSEALRVDAGIDEAGQRPRLPS